MATQPKPDKPYGVIVTVKVNFGFIQPDEPLPEKFARRQLHFRFDNVIGSAGNIIVGTRVQFEIHKKGNPDRPSAYKVWLPKDVTQTEIEDDMDDDITSRKFLGEIVTMKDQFGFIRPETRLPKRYTYGRPQVYFQKRTVLQNVDILEGLTVEFEIDARCDPERPSASRVQILGLPDDVNLDATGSTNQPESNTVTEQDAPKVKKKNVLKDKYEGIIVKILRKKENKSEMGYIKPTEDLPDDFKQGDVFFFSDNVKSGHLTLEEGDKLEFSLGLKDKSKPFALRLKLIECTARPAQKIVDYIDHLLYKGLYEEQKDKQQSPMLEILTCSIVWQCIGETILTSEEIHKLLLLVKEMEKVSRGLEDYFKQVLETLISTKLFNPKIGGFKKVMENMKSSSLLQDEEFLKDIQCFFLIVMKYVPRKIKAVVNLVKPAVSKNNQKQVFLYKALVLLCKSLDVCVEDMEWNELPLVPSQNEILNGSVENSNMQPVKIKGAYSSVEEYIDIYFRLLRADCFEALTNGIHGLLNRKTNDNSIFIYPKIEMAGVVLNQTQHGVCIAMKITTKKKQNWDNCQNLRFGNLVCISPNGNFKDVIWCTVVNRSLLISHNVIVMDLISECNSFSDSEALRLIKGSNVHGMMVESTTYYRAYQPVLKALQTIDPEKLAFQDELVHVCEPLDVRLNLMSNLRLAKELVRDTNLDESQSRAVAASVMKRVCIIQGPPGTGKTFVGIKITQLIISLDPKPKLPILVLTYKNHALDEFMKEMLKLFPGKVARIGGRSQEKDLVACNLNQLKKSKDVQMNQNMFSKIQSFQYQIEQLRPKVEDAFKFMEKCKKLSVDDLRKRLSWEQTQNLLEGCDWNQLKIPSYSSQSVVTIKDKKAKYKRMDNFEAEKILKELNMLAEEYIASPNITDERLKTHVDTMIQVAIKQWLPSEKEFNEIVENTQFEFSSASKAGDYERAKYFNNNDGDEVEKERVAACGEDYTSREEILKQIVMFQMEEQTSEWMPYLIQNAANILQDLPLGYLMNMETLTLLPMQDRILFIQALLLNLFEENGKVLDDLLQEYQRLCAAKHEIENHHKVEILKNMTVIGMTITGASIHHGLLAEIRPEVIIVEEAAEVLESQLLAATADWCKQLILIGDHMQLKPSVASYYLQKKYKTDVSMMERLIENKLEYFRLKKQNRMRPEFAALLTDIYPDLESNYDVVLKNKPPECVMFPMYFWDHNSPEHRDEKTLSYTNDGEVNKAIKLALFLIQQNYEPKKITILCAYLAQAILMRKKMSEAQAKYPEIFAMYKNTKAEQNTEEAKQLNKVQIQTIDNYQGDENDIVIISLVRSNHNGKTGFVNHLNRRCVAQSRARCGMYFIGNKATLSTSDHWGILLDKLTKQDRVGEILPLQCPTHKDVVLLVESADEITLGNFCKTKCGKLMDCNRHQCTRDCQPNHTHTVCREIVYYRISTCGHRVKAKCSDDTKSIRCEEEVYIDLKCGHMAKKSCYQKIEEVKCTHTCNKILKCLHQCRGLCSEPCNADTCAICITLKEIEIGRKRRQEEAEREKIRKEVTEKIEEMKRRPTHEQLVRIELKPEGETASEYYEIEDVVQKYIKKEHKWMPMVKKITKVRNGRLQRKFMEKKKDMFDPSYTPLKFHGTDAIEAIVQGGFILPKSDKPNMFGSGIYFATDSSKSAQKMYTKGSNTLLLCRVLLGKPMTVDSARPEMNENMLKDAGYDSLYAKRDTKETQGVLFDEYVVYHPDCALPEYVIEYESRPYVDPVQSQAPITLEEKALQQSKIMKYEIKPRRVLQINDPLDVHFRNAEAQFLRLTKGKRYTSQSQGLPTVQQVDYYINPHLLKKFMRQAEQFKRKYPGTKEDKSILAFHGTKPENIIGIIKHNFDIKNLSKGSGDNGWYGAGIYFSEFPDISLAYGQSLLLCKVLPGKSYDVTVRIDGQKLKDGYDSHRFGSDKDGRGQELVIDNPDQILPCYVIKLTDKV